MDELFPTIITEGGPSKVVAKAINLVIHIGVLDAEAFVQGKHGALPNVAMVRLLGRIPRLHLQREVEQLLH